MQLDPVGKPVDLDDVAQLGQDRQGRFLARGVQVDIDIAVCTGLVTQRSNAQLWPVSIGERARPASSPPFGPNAAPAWSRWSGYLIGSQQAGNAPLPPEAELQWWYQCYFATDRGRAGYNTYRREFAKLIWRTASPKWNFDDATFDRSAASFDNPDNSDIVIHNYRWRLGLAEGEAELSLT